VENSWSSSMPLTVGAWPQLRLLGLPGCNMLA